MAKAPTLTDITAGFGSATQHNANNAAIETAFQNTLSRDGSTPNTMEADLDLNDNDILNVQELFADTIYLNGTAITSSVATLNDGSVTTAKLADNSVTSAKIVNGTIATADIADSAIDGTKIAMGSDAQGDILYYDGTDWARLAAGTSGQFLKTQGSGSDPVWSTVSTGTEPSDGDKGDITVSGSGLTWSIDAGVVDSAELATSAVTTAKLNNTAVTTAKIADNAVTGAKIALGSDAQGDVMYYDGSDWARLPAGTSGQVLETQGAGANPQWSNKGSGTVGTAVATTSGTSVDFTSLPSGIDQIDILLNNVSTSGSSNCMIQIGTGGSPLTSSYSSGSGETGSNQSSTTGFIFTINASPADSYQAILHLRRIDGNDWVFSGLTWDGSSVSYASGGNSSLSGELDMIRLTTVGGTATYDAGQMNIHYA